MPRSRYVQNQPVFMEGSAIVREDEASGRPLPAGWYVVLGSDSSGAIGLATGTGLDVFDSITDDEEGMPHRTFIRLATGRDAHERAILLANALADAVERERADVAIKRDRERRQDLLDDEPERRIATCTDVRRYGGERRGHGNRALMRARRAALQLSMPELARRVLAITEDPRSVSAQRMQLANFESGKTDTLPDHVLDAVAIVLADAP
jgi:hypothetical protein